MSKEVYKTIKRSISATANGIVNSTPFGSGAHSRLANYTVATASGAVRTKHWIHPPDVLLCGQAEYSVKMLGHTEVSEPKGSHVVRDAIHTLRFHLQIQQGVGGHSGSKLRKVDIHINVNGLRVVDSKTKMLLFNHPLHKISFCADDKQDKRVFSYIANVDSKHECFVFLSNKMAEQITLTIGEAFDLAYERFIKKNGRLLDNQKLIVMLRKRVNELEAEVGRLQHQLAASQQPQAVLGAPPQYTPAVPTTPIPPAPTAAAQAPQQSASGSSSIPPPQTSQQGTKDTTMENGIGVPPNHNEVLFSLNDIFAKERQGPDVGTRLENLQLDKLEDLFDEDFNPRAGESGASSSRLEQLINGGGEEEPESDLDAMLRKVNEKIMEQMRLGDGIPTGDTGDAGRDFEPHYSQA